jgi:flagellin-like hook-associated protein FlgL
MLINTNNSTTSALDGLLNQRPAGGASGSQTSSTEAGGANDSQLDPSLQRLTDLPVGVQDADWAIEDEHGAGSVLEALRQGMLGQPGTALSAQANQLPANVMSLLE